MNPPRLFALALAATCLAAGSALAAAHPLWPGWLLAGFVAATALVWRTPRAWLLLLPALLPIANAAPWSGWQLFEEFDLLLLAALAGGYLERARRPSPPAAWPQGRIGLALAGFALICALNGARGLFDGGGDWSLWGDYLSPANCLRVGKSSLFALLLLPLLRQAWHDDARQSVRLLAGGMSAGATLVALAVLWERGLFPGWLDFSEPYRTTAFFWEMHVGGAALDAYLVLTTPFVLWAVLAAKRPLHWAAAALLALIFAYACLTTFARGVYLGATIALLVFGYARLHRHLPRLGTVLSRLALYLAAAIVFGIALGALYGWGGGTLLAGGAVASFALAVWRRHTAWGSAWLRWGGATLLLALAVEVVTVLYGGSFMFDRLAASHRDFGKRLEHWQHGVALVASPADWLFGKGIGRLPAHYAQAGPFGELSGRAGTATDATGNTYLRLSGPTSRARLGGLLALTQRVAIDPARPLHVALEARTEHAGMLFVQVCERHLLFPANCRQRSLSVPASGERWLPLRFQLDDGSDGGAGWQAGRPQLLALSVLSPGTTIDLDDVVLSNGRDTVLVNGHFDAGRAHWLPVAQYYFLPWHIDNFYLEVLIERGLVGVAAFAALLLLAWHRLGTGPVAGTTAAPYLLAALVALPALGLVSSVLDAPRVAWLFQFLLLVALTLPPAVRDKCIKPVK